MKPIFVLFQHGILLFLSDLTMITTIAHQSLNFTLKSTDGSLSVLNMESFKLHACHRSSERLKLLFIKHLKFGELAIRVDRSHSFFGFFLTNRLLEKLLELLVNLKSIHSDSFSESVIDFSSLLPLDRVIVLLDSLFLELSFNILIDSWRLNMCDLTELGHNSGKLLTCQMRWVIVNNNRSSIKVFHTLVFHDFWLQELVLNPYLS